MYSTTLWITRNEYETVAIEYPPLKSLKEKKIKKKAFYRKSAFATRRTRQQIRRIINSNFFESFITLTFADNVKDVIVANKEFKKFVQRMKYVNNDFAYLAVPELTRKGRLHFHVVSNYQPEEYNKKAETMFMLNFWKQGFVNIRKIKDFQNIGSYLSKYLSKDSGNFWQSQKRYFCSKNLQRPFSMQITDVQTFDESLILEYTNKYKSPYVGLIIYKYYRIKK